MTNSRSAQGPQWHTLIQNNAYQGGSLVNWESSCLEFAMPCTPFLQLFFLCCWRKDKKAACFRTIRNYAKILRHKIAPEMLGMQLGRVQGSIASMQELLDLQPLGRKRKGIWIKGRITRGRDKASHSFCIWFLLN